MAATAAPAAETEAGRGSVPGQPSRRFVALLTPHLPALLVFAVAPLLMTWPLVAGLKNRLVSWGDPVFQTWTIAWVVHAWRHAPLDVFDANIFFPYRNTLAYSDHLFGQAALVAPVLLATGNVILANNIAVLMALSLSGFAMYLLVYDLTGSRLAGIVAGFAYAFAPARMSHLEHLHMLSAQWLPLAILAARRALLENSGRWAAALGAIVLLQGLFGIYFLYFLLVLLGVVFSAYLIWRPARQSLTAVARCALACAVAGALLLPTLLPYQQVHEDLGIERSEDEVTLWRARASDYLAVSPRNRLYGDWLGEQDSAGVERKLFPGLLLMALALAGLAGRRLGWERAMLAAVVITAVVLSFGLTATIAGRELPLPYRLPYDLVPGFRAIRVPARFALLALVGLCALAGLGAHVLLRRLPHAERPTGARQLAALGLSAAMLLVLAAEHSTRVPLPDPLPTSLVEANRPDYAWMAANPAPAIEFPMGEGVVGSAWPNFWSTFHWNQVVNGFSGLTPPVYYEFRERMRAFPSPETIELLQGIGVETVVYHSDPGVPASEDAFLLRVARYDELRQVVDGPDYVFTLAPDPWAWRLAGALPEGAEVDLTALSERDPVTFGMVAAVLQRHGHTVYGSGQLAYWRVPSPPADVCLRVSPEDVPVDGWRRVGEFGPLALWEDPACRAR